MTLMKSILLGSAAGIVAVAGAQAADLPTHKAAPVIQYVQICNVGGITGWVMPGSDTCVKLSGYITAQFTGGNLENQYNWSGSITSAQQQAIDPFAVAHSDQRILVQGGDQAVPIFNAITGQPITTPTTTTTQIQNGVPVTITTPGTQLIKPNTMNNIFNRHQVGWTTRANFGFDFASNTAYGPLIGHFDINSENGNGFDNTGNLTYLNTGYLTWAGITAGKAQSFYSFTGGGDNWANFASPDQKGFNEPDLLAYTASFGGGFTATIAAQSQGTNGGSGGGTNMTGAASNGSNTFGSNPGDITFGGQKWPDIVGALHVKQGWGEAQVSGVVHNVNVKDYTFFGTSPLSLCGQAVSTVTTFCNAAENKVGWGIDAGVKFNLPTIGAGDNILFTGSWTRNAVWYSGLPDMMWGENGQVNGNGQPMYLADAFFNPLTNQWSTPTAWSVSGLFEHHFTPQFYVDLEGSVGGIEWSNMGGGCQVAFGCALGQFGAGALSPHAFTWLIGADLGWNPVTNLNFDLELMYQSTNQERPSGFLGTVFNNGAFVPGAWEGNSNGFAGRFRITRYF
jgi:Porin subfamily